MFWIQLHAFCCTFFCSVTMLTSLGPETFIFDDYCPTCCILCLKKNRCWRLFEGVATPHPVKSKQKHKAVSCLLVVQQPLRGPFLEDRAPGVPQGTPREPPGNPGKPRGTPGNPREAIKIENKKSYFFFSILVITPLWVAPQTLKPIFLASWDSNAFFHKNVFFYKLGQTNMNVEFPVFPPGPY